MSPGDSYRARCLRSSKANSFADDTLLKVSQLSKLHSPTSYNLSFLRLWSKRPEMGAIPLLGHDQKAWDPDYEADLVASGARIMQDGFSEWVHFAFMPWAHGVLGERFKVSPSLPVLALQGEAWDQGHCSNTSPSKRPLETQAGGGIYQYRSTSIERLVRILTTVVASLLPMVSVVVLFIVSSDAVRLGMIAVFSALFSLSLVIMTTARAVEVFVATAA